VEKFRLLETTSQQDITRTLRRLLKPLIRMAGSAQAMLASCILTDALRLLIAPKTFSSSLKENISHLRNLRTFTSTLL